MGEAIIARPRNWWMATSVYQIWPASYKDSTGTGVGDIPGIISTLPYLHSLGVETIWLSPMYKSPQHDMGYDISDYEAIHEPYGTMDDMLALIDGCHKLGMKILLDLVINHTSDEHAWFEESRKDRVNAKADWYMWKDPKIVNGERRPPNNWASAFEGSAWEYEPARDQYYLHLFAREQPDLNWENEVTRKAIYGTSIRFWLKRGVDGFRIDTCNIYSKVPGLPDATVVDPSQEWQPPWKLCSDGPRAHEFLKEMRKVFDEFGDIMTVGELGLADSKEKILKYVDASRMELNEIFDFQMLQLGRDVARGPAFFQPFPLSDMKKSWIRGQGLIEGTDAWTTTFGENHDSGRSVSRFATRDPKWHEQASKVMAAMTATMSGTLFLYQGQEIGMTNVPSSWGPEEYKDISAINIFADIEKRYGRNSEMFERTLEGLNMLGRDNARTPVQWTDGHQAGFTTGTPWMRVNDNYKVVNAASQVQDPKSIRSFWRHLLKIRKKHQELFVFGRFQLLDPDNNETFCFYKHGDDGKKALVQLNFTAKQQPACKASGELVVSNVEHLSKDKLGPWEVRIHVMD